MRAAGSTRRRPARPLMHPSSARATQLLNRLGRGEGDASTELWPLVYAELHSIAEAQMAREQAQHTLQPTALVHEAYLRLIGRDEANYPSRRHFYALAAQVMRSLLVDHARKKRAKKRGGDRVRIALEGASPENSEERDVSLVDLDAALEELNELDGDLARSIELRFFGGLPMKDVAETLDVPLRTAERRVQVATAWLRDRLDG